MTEEIRNNQVVTQEDADPRNRSMASWRGRLAVMASRGEVNGPRVQEAQRALSWYRLVDAFRAEVRAGFLTEDQARELVDQLPVSITEAVTDEQLDAAILNALRQIDGETAPWAELRRMLPERRTSRTADALVRLVDAGRVHVVKVDGRNFVGLAITLGRPA